MSGVGRKKNERDEVEELLRAAEDEMLLKINTGAHPIRSTSAPVDRDLAPRFDALKSPSAPAGIAKMPLPPSRKELAEGSVMGKEEEELKRILGDDLLARFSALKGSSTGFQEHPEKLNKDNGGGDAINDDDDDDEDDDDDGVSKREVEKLIEWAKDAARLDLSISDDEDYSDVDDNDDEDEDDVDFDDDYRKKGKKREEKVKR